MVVGLLSATMLVVAATDDDGGFGPEAHYVWARGILCIPVLS